MLKYFSSVVISLGLVALVIFCLAGCKPGNTGSDGYRFETKNFTQNTMAVKVEVHKTQSEMERAYAETQGKPLADDRQLAAFSIINRFSDGSEICTIHMIDPAVSYQPEFIGHEFAHCAFGQFHPNQP